MMILELNRVREGIWIGKSEFEKSNIMKISILQLQQFIQEELEAELEEAKKKKKKKKDKKKKKKSDKHFSPKQSPAAADKTFSDCMKKVKKTVKPRGSDTKKQAAAKICTDTRKAKGATLDWGKEREKKVEKARPGGKSGNESKK